MGNAYANSVSKRGNHHPTTHTHTFTQSTSFDLQSRRRTKLLLEGSRLDRARSCSVGPDGGRRLGAVRERHGRAPVIQRKIANLSSERLQRRSAVATATARRGRCGTDRTVYCRPTLVHYTSLTEHTLSVS